MARGQRGITVFLYGLAVTLAAALGPGVGPAVAQSTEGNLSTDQLLQYTLNDLKRRMQQLVKNNQDLAKRNQALRKRILFLGQQVRAFQNQRLKLMGQVPELSGDVSVNQQGTHLGDQEMAAAKDKRDQLRTQRGTLQGYLRDEDAHGSQLKGQVADTKEKIGQLQNKLDQLGEGRSQASREKARVLDSLGREKSILDKKQQEVKSLQDQLAGLQRNLRDLSARRDQVRAQVSDMQTQLAVAQKKETALKQKQQQRLELSKATDREARQIIDTLRRQKTTLESSLEVIRSKYDGNSIKPGGEERQLKEYYAVLQEENTALKDKVLTLTAALEKLRAQEPGPHHRRP